METQMENVLKTMREYMARTKRAVLSGGLELDQFEIDANSFIQLIEHRPGSKDVWRYHQYRVADFSEDVRNMFIGKYLNEYVKNFKIIGIYKWIDPK